MSHHKAIRIYLSPEELAALAALVKDGQTTASKLIGQLLTSKEGIAKHERPQAPQ